MKKTGSINSLRDADRAVHSWYRFVLSFPPHLVSEYLRKLEVTPEMRVLDPFCGTGTTLVECLKKGIPSVGVEAHPMPLLSAQVKTNWDLDTKKLKAQMDRLVRRAEEEMDRCSLDKYLSIDKDLLFENDEDYNGRDSTPHNPRFELGPEERKIMPKGFLSPRPLARLLILRDAIQKVTARSEPAIGQFFMLGLANVAVTGAGNFAFGPEIYRTKAKEDYDVLNEYVKRLQNMISDLEQMRLRHPTPPRRT